MKKLSNQIALTIPAIQKCGMLALLLIPLLGWGQATVVNYDFNSSSATSYATLTPALAPSVTAAVSSTEGFAVSTGTATGANAFTANTTAGKALATSTLNTGTHYYDFSLSGSALSQYSEFKLYVQSRTTVTGPTFIRLEYSLNGGGFTPLSTQVYSVNSSFVENVFDLSGIAAINNPASSLTFRLVPGVAGAATGTWRLDNFQVQGVPPLSVSPATLALNSTTKGTPSTSKLFKLTGSNLGSTVTVTAPTGFELATSSGGFVAGTTSLTVSTTSGSISKNLYVRLAGTSAGVYSGNITSTSGAIAVNTAVSGTVMATLPVVQPTVVASNSTFNTVDIALSGGDGQKRLLVLRTPTASTTTVPKSKITYTASTVRSAATSPGTGIYVIVADGSTTTATITALSSNQAYTLSVYSYNDDGVAGAENYLAASPGTASFTTLPSPISYYAKSTGSLNVLATFGTNADGSGTSPTAFTTSDKTYLVSGTGRTIGGTWTVSGTNSKIVLATGASFTIPVGKTFAGLVDLQSNATLTVQSSAVTGLVFGDLSQTSTVEFAQTSGTYSVPAPSLGYGNLKLTNGTKQFAAGATSIGGNLQIQDVDNVGGSSTSALSTVLLAGNLTLLSNTTFDPTTTRRISLRLTAATPQTLAGNGNILRLFRLATYSSGGGAILSDATGGTPVEVGGSALSSGIDLTEGSTLALNANTLAFTPGSTATLSNTGTFTLAPTSSLNLETTAPAIGTLYLTPAATTLNNLRVATLADDYLLVSQSLTINGKLDLDVVGTLDIGAGQTLTLNGTVAGTGTVRGSATSDLVIGGTTGTADFGTLSLASGTTGSALHNFTLNRTTTGSIALGSPAIVNGTFALTNGMLTTSATGLLRLAASATLSGGSSSSFVNGPFSRTTAPGGSTTFFPIGKATGVLTAYRPITLSSTAQTSTTTFTAEQNETPPTQNLTATDPSGTVLKRVSYRRYFTITPDAAPTGFSGTVTLSFGLDDFVNLPANNGFVVAKRSLSPPTWVNIGRSSNSGVANGGLPVAGTLTSGTFTDFASAADFSLASTVLSLFFPGTNPLPVELVRFEAMRQTSGVRLTWATASEQHSARFEVERSLDGKIFAPVLTVAAQGNSTQPTTYAGLDGKAPASQLYYRLRQVDLDGTANYSNVVAVAGTGAPLAELVVYPNPTTGHLSATLPAASGRTYRVLNALGQVVGHGSAEAANPTVEVGLLPAGLYFLELRTANCSQVRRFVKND